LKALITHGLESKTMKQIRACGALVALALSGAAWSSSHIVDNAWSSDGRFAHEAQIPAGSFV